MSATIQAVMPVSCSTEIPERTLLAGLGLTSFAALLLELALNAIVLRGALLSLRVSGNFDCAVGIGCRRSIRLPAEKPPGQD